MATLQNKQHPSNNMVKTHEDSSSRLVFLDYLRIFAFTSVIIGHKFHKKLYLFAEDPSTPFLLKSILHILLPSFYAGGAGVIVFFFVSGYIITHVLQKEKTLEFVIKRIFRIYPLYMAAVLVQNLELVSQWMTSPALIPEQLPTLLSQLFLVGDLFGTPHSLQSLEWTLRIEVLFYLYMAILHSLGVMHRYQKLFPYVLISSAILLWVLPAFPTWNKPIIGNTNIYAPFLLLGAMFYLAEKKQTHYAVLLIFILLVFFKHYALVHAYQPRWNGRPFALYALVIFASAWLLRRHIAATTTVLLISDLTYAAYLLHGWHYKYIKEILIQNSFTSVTAEIITMIVFFIICFLAVKYIEKPGIKLGRWTLAKLEI